MSSPNPRLFQQLFKKLVTRRPIQKKNYDSEDADQIKVSTYYESMEEILVQTIEKFNSLVSEIASDERDTIFHSETFVRKILNTLIYLTKPVDSLLSSGILNMYLELVEFQSQIRNSQAKGFSDYEYMQEIICVSEPLLFELLVYQEYAKIENSKRNIFAKFNRNQKTDKRPSLSSSDSNRYKKGIKDSIKEPDVEDIEIIKADFVEKSLKELLTKYLKEYERNINETEEVCKICSKNIKLTHLEGHVAYCQEKCIVKDKISKWNNKCNDLAMEVIQDLQNSLVSDEKTMEFAELQNGLIKTNKNPAKGLYNKDRRTCCIKKIKESVEEGFKRIENLQLFCSSSENISRVETVRKQIQIEQQLLKLHLEHQRIEEEFDKLREITSSSTIRERSIKSNGKSDKKSRFASEKKSEKSEKSKVSSKISFIYERSVESLSNKVNSERKIKFKDEEEEQFEELPDLQIKGIKNKFSEMAVKNVKFVIDCNESFENSSTRNSSIMRRKKKCRSLVTFNSSSMGSQSEGEDNKVNRGKSKFKPQKQNQGQEESNPQNELTQLIDFSESTSRQGQEISLSQFEILKFIGKGAFGRVYAVRRKATEDLYALKMIDIGCIADEKELQQIRNEHEIFKKIAGDHLVKAPFCFSEGKAHFFVMEFMSGGDLSQVLSEEVYLEEERAKMVIAEIVLAIEHLHEADIIHRDLKPENLVVDGKGHLKLTDFGLSELKMQDKLEKVLNIHKKEKESAPGRRRERKRRTAIIPHRASSAKLIGTPDYIAPEIINGISINNKSIDWWSLGVMTYEILVGARPFCGDTIQEVLNNITQFKIEWPEIGDEEGMVSQTAQDLMIKLLESNFMTRLGVNGAQQIKEHPFFEGIDWDNIKKSPAAVYPNQANIADLLEMDENELLRTEIKDKIGVNFDQKSGKNLESFVRFDILGTETLESGKKMQNRNATTLKRLKSIKQFLNTGADDTQDDGFETQILKQNKKYGTCNEIKRSFNFLRSSKDKQFASRGCPINFSEEEDKKSFGKSIKLVTLMDMDSQNEIQNQSDEKQNRGEEVQILEIATLKDI